MPRIIVTVRWNFRQYGSSFIFTIPFYRYVPFKSFSSVFLIVCVESEFLRKFYQ